MVKVKDLKAQTGISGTNTILYCWFCNSEYSANLCDYWNVSPEHEFHCCNEPLELYIKEVHFVKVEKTT